MKKTSPTLLTVSNFLSKYELSKYEVWVSPNRWEGGIGNDEERKGASTNVVRMLVGATRSEREELLNFIKIVQITHARTSLQLTYYKRQLTGRGDRGKKGKLSAA